MIKAHPKIIVVARDKASSYAEAINEVLPEAVQIADRFHLFQNLLTYLKDLFYSEIPDKIVIKNNKVLDKKATKEIKELDENKLNSLSYNNDLPIDDKGNIINFIDLQYHLNDSLHQQQAKNKQKKHENIIYIRNETNLTINELENKYNYCASSIKKLKNA